MENGNRTTAAVIGAGIGGLTTAIALRRVGVDVEVYERAGALRPAGFGLSLQGNAVASLRTLDIDLGLEKRGQEVISFNLLHPDGRLMRSMDFGQLSRTYAGAPSYCLDRSDLRAALLEEAGDCPIHLGVAATGYRNDPDGVRVRFADGREVHADLLVGADGIHSAIRRQLVGAEEPRTGGFVCWLATQEFAHPNVPRGASNHYWGAGMRFGMHDVGDGRIYWWGTKNATAEQARDWQGGKDDVIRAYAGWAEEVQDIIAATPEAGIIAVPAQDRPFRGRWGEGAVTLLGDAAHPMLPSLGQGAGSSVEDAVILAHCLSNSAEPVGALRRYEELRRKRTRMLVNKSRSLGRIEQLEAAFPRAVRSVYFRQAPKAVLRQVNKRPMTPPPAPEKVAVGRTLGALERWHWIADQISPLNVVARARVHGALTEALLRQRLDAVQARHPLLRVAVVADPDGSNPRFVPADDRPIPLRLAEGADWEQEVDGRELTEPLGSAEGPLLRAVLLSSGPETHDVLLTLSHTIADGSTALALLAELLRLGDDKARVATPTRPAPEAMLPAGHRGVRGSAKMLRMAVGGQLTALRRRPGRLAASQNVEFGQRRTRFVHREITGAVHSGLRQACEREGVTVVDATAAALLTAVARDGDPDRSRVYGIGFPTQLRDDFVPGLTRAEPGAYMTMIPAYARYAPDAPAWTVAREIDTELARRAARGEHLSGLRLLGLLCPKSPGTSAKSLRLMEDNGPGNVWLYHATQPAAAGAGPWQVCGMQFVCGASVSSYLMVSVSTDDDGLQLNFAYANGILTPERVHAIAAEVVDVLGRMAA